MVNSDRLAMALGQARRAAGEGAQVLIIVSDAERFTLSGDLPWPEARDALDRMIGAAAPKPRRSRAKPPAPEA